MNFNRKLFFASYKAEFGSLNQIQTDGLNRLLLGYENYFGWWDSIPQIANSLAQVKWETAHSFHPVVEGYYLGDRHAPGFYTGNTASVRKFQEHLRYFPHFGRGDIQLTWEENYREQDALIRQYFPKIVADFEMRTGAKFDLIKFPEQVLDGWISFCVMTIGMHKGTFREGQTLDRYFNPTRHDHYGARNIVNGDAGKKVDGRKIGDHIKEIADKFERVLSRSREKIAPADTELTTDNIENKFDDLNINSDQNDSANGSLPADSFPENTAGFLPENPSETSGQSEPVPNTVSEVKQIEESATPDGKKTVEASETTLPGDAPDAAPRSWFNVEDWKPWVFGKLKTTAKTFTGFNATQGTATVIAAFKSGDYWYVPIIAGITLFLLTFVIAAVVAFVLLLIWYFNRREIKDYKTLELAARHDPSRYNFGLKFEKIGECVSGIFAGGEK